MTKFNQDLIGKYVHINIIRKVMGRYGIMSDDTIFGYFLDENEAKYEFYYNFPNFEALVLDTDREMIKLLTNIDSNKIIWTNSNPINIEIEIIE